MSMQNINCSQMSGQRQRRPHTQTFITQERSNLCLRFFRKIDIFSFIPVPKDDVVSTRASLIGSTVFFALFLAYIIYDFVKFVNNNPPIIQAYNTPLDDNYYTLPSFALAFMDNNPYYNHTESYDNFFTYSWNTKVKTMGNQFNVPINMEEVTYLNGNQTNFDLIDWMNTNTKQFYYILRTPSQPLKARGLLFTSNITVYPSIKLSFCTGSDCLSGAAFYNLTNFGRLFLFIQQIPDTSTIATATSNSNGNNYLQYNFFVIQGFYKRITISIQVVNTQVLPDYFWRWSTQNFQRLQITSVNEQMSKVDTIVTSNTDAIAFNFQLAPNIVNNRVSYSTLLDHISLWGAFWGVLFAVFALFFLSHNRKKFYNKNPEWSKFKRSRENQRSHSDLIKDQLQ